VSRTGGGELTLPVAQSAKVSEVELLLQPSTVAAALANVRELLSYPYGCLEQLVATTVPNLALYQTLQKTNALDKLDPESTALLAEARSRSVQGTKRILQLAVKGGGFTWFGGYSTPSLPLTLIALDGLSYGIDAGLVERTDARVVESARWLEAQGDLPVELEATRAYVLARLEGERHAGRVRALVQREAGDAHSVALAVLAAEKAGVLKEPGLKDQLQRHIESSQESFGRLANLELDPHAYWRYPLRRIGLSAVLAHAASFGSLDVGLARQRILEAMGDPALSTFDRSTLLLHSLWLIERDAKELRAMTPPSVEGAKFAAYGAGQRAVLTNAPRTVKVGDFKGVATLRARVVTPLAEVRPKSAGMSVERRYFVLRDGSKKELIGGEKVHQGEEVYVELTLNASGHQGLRSAYYVLEDPIPAGFVPLLEDKTFRGAPYELPLAHEALKRRSLSPERATFFFEEPTWWSDTPRTIGFVMRAQFPGKFSAPPTTIEDMYATQVRGHGAVHTLEVAGAR
jgi:uncharacterized protein YfaS (alpha-2-macroglobulin family)